MGPDTCRLVSITSETMVPETRADGRTRMCVPRMIIATVSGRFGRGGGSSRRRLNFSVVTQSGGPAAVPSR